MFCGFCLSNDNEQESELIIRDALSNVTDQRITRKNRSEVLSHIVASSQYSMLVPSKYNTYVQECQQTGVKFEDPEFIPNLRSVGVEIPKRAIIWKRVTEVVKNAVMVENQIEPGDVQQGNVGDCYFLASISSIAEVPERIKSIFCNQMALSPHGIYRLQIASQGELREIVIDDYVPVFEGTYRPVFCKPKHNEVWVMLLEKAWAKVSGSYGNTSAGYPHEVLNTFLPAPCFYYEISYSALKSEQEREQLWRYLHEGEHFNFAMCAGSRPAHVCQGIKPGHTYSLLACYEVAAGSEKVRLVKMRNPWGDTEFQGRYSEHDEPFWSRVDIMTKLAIFKKKNEDDGIFTMELNEFIRNFECLDVSHDHPGFNYVFQKLRVTSGNPFFYEITINGNSQGDFYFTIEKAFDRNAYIKQRRVDYGYSKLLIASKRNINVNGNAQTVFEYVNSKLQTNFPDLTIRCKNMQPGTYIIYGETAFPGNPTGTVTLSVYSRAIMEIQKISTPHNHFLHRVFIDHGKRHNQERMEIMGCSQDWTASKFLFDEGGFGYIMAELGKDSHNRIRIICNVQKVFESGFSILERDISRPAGTIEIEVNPGQQSIVVFGVNFLKAPREIDFPPKGIRITRVV